MIPPTSKGHGFFEASSAFQKSIRRADEKHALYFGIDFFWSGKDEYIWKRMKLIASEDVGLAVPAMPAIIGSLYQFATESKKGAPEGQRPDLIFFVHAIILLARAKKSKLIDWASLAMIRSFPTMQLEIPDWAHDKHTIKGKRMGRGIDHFYDEGSKVSNHVPQEGEKEYKEQARKLALACNGAKTVFPSNKPKKGRLFDEE